MIYRSPTGPPPAPPQGGGPLPMPPGGMPPGVGGPPEAKEAVDPAVAQAMQAVILALKQLQDVLGSST